MMILALACFVFHQTVYAGPLLLGNSSNTLLQSLVDETWSKISWHEDSQTWSSEQFCGPQHGVGFDDSVKLKEWSYDVFDARAKELEHIHLRGGDRVDQLKLEYFDLRDSTIHGG